MRFYVTAGIGVFAGVYFWKVATLHESLNEAVARSPLWVAILSVIVTGFASYHYFKYLRTESDVCWIPAIERYCFLVFLALIFSASHYCLARVSVDQQQLVMYEPAFSWLEDGVYKFNDIQLLELGADHKGREKLRITIKEQPQTKLVSSDGLIRAILPRLSTVAKAHGIQVHGF